jgi:type I restriction enzyme S subunit
MKAVKDKMNSWQEVRLGSVVIVNPPCARPSGDTLVTFISMADVSAEAKIVTPQIRSFASVATGFTCFEEGDVLVAKITPCFENGKGAFACNLKNGRGAGSTEFHVLRPKLGVDGRFLHLISRTSRFRKIGENKMEGSAGQRRLPASYLKTVRINLPPLLEQRKIAAILTTWDEVLEKLDALIAAKERRKKALIQQLLTGKRRKPGHASWKIVKLSEVAEEQGERNKTTLDRSRLFAVTKADGMVPMRERVQGATINRCKIVERGWFAYNPMRINIGSIARWEENDPVMVSADYVVFKTDETRLLSSYLHYVRQSAAWAGFVGASGNGSVRIRIWFDDLGRFKFPLPTLSEQSAIVNILDSCDKELRLLRDKRTAVDQQKRGLMQKLLTGKVRVK